MKTSNFLTAIFLMLFSFFQSQTLNEKIGIIFKFEGPLIVRRDVIENIPRNYENNDEKNKYYDAVKAMENENINPRKRIVDFYQNSLKEKGIEFIIIDKTLTEENFPKFDGKRKFYSLNIQNIKKEFDVNKVLIVECQYRFEFESVGIISGDKRTNIFLNNNLVDTNNNSIIKNFRIQNIKNITKKGLLNPPNYPNIEESMSRLLNERIFPALKTEIQNL